MITPLCYFSHNPKEGTTSNFNDPVSNKITAITTDRHNDWFFNRSSFSMMDLIYKKFDKSIINRLVVSIKGTRLYVEETENQRIGNELRNTIRTSVFRKLTQIFPINYENN